MPRHRHLVALPALLLITSLAVVPTFFHLSSLHANTENAVVSGENTPISLPSGTFGILHEGFLQGHSGILRLQKGSATLASDGVLQMEVRDALLTGLRGAFYASLDDQQLTIAALTTPVSVSLYGQSMVVPVGMQWQVDLQKGMAPLSSEFRTWIASRTPQKIPLAFLERKRADLATLTQPVVSLPAATWSIPESTVFDALMLPVSKMRALQERSERLLGSLRYAVEHGQTHDVRTIVQDATFSDVLSTYRGRNVVAHLLSTKDSVNLDLLQLLVQDSQLWAVASLHPVYQAETWSLFGPDAPSEQRVARVFLFPWSLFSVQKASALSFHRFGEELIAVSKQAGDTGSTVLEYALSVHMPLIAELEESGFPKRAELLRSTYLQRISDTPMPTKRLEQFRIELQRSTDISTDMLPEPEEPSEVQPQKEPSRTLHSTLSPEEVEQRAYAMLTEAGAIFSVETNVSSYAPDEARVHRVLFASHAEDKEVSFTLNVVTQNVYDIEIEGKGGFPYSPQFTDFVRWLVQ